MQISFDAENPREVAAVAALAAALGNPAAAIATSRHQQFSAASADHVRVAEFPAQPQVDPYAASAETIRGQGPGAEGGATFADAAAPADAETEVDPAVAFGAPPLSPAATSGSTAAAAAPPPPSAPAAPSGPPSAPAAQTQSHIEVDADGLPWDGRIHSGPADKRPKNADGTWRKKRGVTAEEVAVVTAQLRQTMAVPGPLAPATTATEAATSTTPHTSAAASAPNPPPPPAPAATAPPPPPAAQSGDAGAISDFAGLMRHVTGLQGAGKLTISDTMALAQQIGLTGLRDFMARPDLIPQFLELLPK